MALPPGSTIGIIGGGQLGRMLALAAAQLGYRCHVYDPHEAPCAAEVAAGFTRGAFDDAAALADFAAACDVVTYEFENLPTAPLEALANLLPGTKSLTVTQERGVEKRFLVQAGVRIAPWALVDDQASLEAALATLGLPVLLKTRRFGYDGKGQAWIRDPGDAPAAWQAIGKRAAVAEAGMEFSGEFSVIVARAADGEASTWPVSRNIHRDGVLRRSEVPAGDPIDGMVPEAIEIATRLAAELGHVGVMTVEFFACADGPVVNEIAPRVHNSGHWTIEGAVTSQFEQHIRAICGLPLGDTTLTGASVSMANLIGDDVDQWPTLIGERGTHLHLYNKGEARAGRKMGHVTRIS